MKKLPNRATLTGLARLTGLSTASIARARDEGLNVLDALALRARFLPVDRARPGRRPPACAPIFVDPAAVAAQLAVIAKSVC